MRQIVQEIEALERPEIRTVQEHRFAVVEAEFAARFLASGGAVTRPIDHVIGGEVRLRGTFNHPNVMAFYLTGSIAVAADSGVYSCESVR